MRFNETTTDYFIGSIFYLAAGCTAFGFIPILSSYIDLTNEIELKNSKDRLKESNLNFDENSKNEELLIDKIDEEEELQAVHKISI